MNQDWYIKHSPTDRGNKNCCGGSLKNCLMRVKQYTEHNPKHPLITIFLDKKENWSDHDEFRKPYDLDQLIVSVFPKEQIITPAIILGGSTSLKEAVQHQGWPILDSMRGKVVFAITKATEITQRNCLNEYLSAQGKQAICFVAPEIASIDEIESPSGIDKVNATNIVFYNLTYQNRFLAKAVHTINGLSRVYGAPESKTSIEELTALQTNFIALFNFTLSRP